MVLAPFLGAAHGMPSPWTGRVIAPPQTRGEGVGGAEGQLTGRKRRAGEEDRAKDKKGFQEAIKLEKEDLKVGRWRFVQVRADNPAPAHSTRIGIIEEEDLLKLLDIFSMRQEEHRGKKSKSLSPVPWFRGNEWVLVHESIGVKSRKAVVHHFESLRRRAQSLDVEGGDARRGMSHPLHANAVAVSAEASGSIARSTHDYGLHGPSSLRSIQDAAVGKPAAASIDATTAYVDGTTESTAHARVHPFEKPQELTQTEARGARISASGRKGRVRASEHGRQTGTCDARRMTPPVPDTMSVEAYGIKHTRVHHNLSPAHLYEEAVRAGTAEISCTGALVARSGERTERLPKAKRVVDTPWVHKKVWWNPAVNVPISEDIFRVNRQRAVDYLSTLHEELFVMDVFSGWDRAHRLRIRVITYSAYHALVIRCMFIQACALGLDAEYQRFSEPDVLVLDAGRCSTDVRVPGMTSEASVDLKLPEGEGTRGEIVVLGTEYVGEIKEAVFSIMHWLLPPRRVIPLHCSASKGPRGPNDVSLFFGLSGAGKTTLSTDPDRKLIGDDEHGWSSSGTFCFEAGNFAKVIDLDPAKEPDIFNAVNRFGAVMENVPLDPVTRECNFSDRSITENTRASYPITHIKNSLVPCVAGQPRNIIFLTYDVFGVLPLVSRLSPEAAQYHFLSGYSGKLNVTKVGTIEPVAVFSAAFGGQFLVRLPREHSQLFHDLLCASKETTCWLVSTGWVGGSYGAPGAHRVPLHTSRRILEAIHQGSLDPHCESLWTRDPACFNLWIPKAVHGVESALLNPRDAWANGSLYDATARVLATRFKDNFDKNYTDAPGEIRAAGPL